MVVGGNNTIPGAEQDSTGRIKYIWKKKERIGDLKRHIFYELSTWPGTVMVLVKYSPDVYRNRGFVGRRRRQCLILGSTPR